MVNILSYNILVYVFSWWLSWRRWKRMERPIQIAKVKQNKIKKKNKTKREKEKKKRKEFDTGPKKKVHRHQKKKNFENKTHTNAGRHTFCSTLSTVEPTTRSLFTVYLSVVLFSTDKPNHRSQRVCFFFEIYQCETKHAHFTFHSFDKCIKKEVNRQQTFCRRTQVIEKNNLFECLKGKLHMCISFVLRVTVKLPVFSLSH